MAVLNVALANANVFASPFWGTTSTSGGHTYYTPGQWAQAELNITVALGVTATLGVTINAGNAADTVSYSTNGGTSWANVTAGSTGWQVLNLFTLTANATTDVLIQRENGYTSLFDSTATFVITYTLTLPTLSAPSDQGTVISLTTANANIAQYGTQALANNGNSYIFQNCGAHPDSQITFRAQASSIMLWTN